MDQIVNNIQLTWNLVRILKAYKTCNSTIRSSKYEFYNKLLTAVTLLKVKSGETWTQPIYIYNVYVTNAYFFSFFLRILSILTHIHTRREGTNAYLSH